MSSVFRILSDCFHMEDEPCESAAILVAPVPCYTSPYSASDFSVPKGLTYPDYTVFQCPQRSDLSRLHCIPVSPEV